MTYKEARRQQQREAQARLRLFRVSRGLCVTCQSPSASHRCCACKARATHQRRIQNREAFGVLRAQFGPDCVCCGESDPAFLTLDHINDDGNMQRRANSVNFDYASTLSRFRRNGWPDDLQVMCMNCNLGKERNGGVCPHILRMKVGAL